MCPSLCTVLLWAGLIPPLGWIWLGGGMFDISALSCLNKSSVVSGRFQCLWKYCRPDQDWVHSWREIHGWENMQNCRKGRGVPLTIHWLDLPAELPGFSHITKKYVSFLLQPWRSPQSLWCRLALLWLIKPGCVRLKVLTQFSWHLLIIKWDLLKLFRLARGIWQLLLLSCTNKPNQQSHTKGKRVSCSTQKWQMS